MVQSHYQSLLYVEIPVNLILKTPEKDVRFFGGAGPYLGIGVAGKNKSNGKSTGVAFSSEENIKWSNDDPSTLNYEEGAGYGIMAVWLWCKPDCWYWI